MSVVRTLAVLIAVLSSAAVVNHWLHRAGRTDPTAGQPRPGDLPELDLDVFREMDGGIPLAADEIEGRNTWNLWCAGNERFWDDIAREGDGLFDLLKTMDSRDRERRLEKYGLINQPGFRRAAQPDRYGLWLDEGAEPPGIDPKVYGRPSGILGFRLFDNPDFTGEAVTRWQAHVDRATGEAAAFYGDPSFGAQRDLVRPYLVGVSCGACHIAFHPCHPPANPNAPEYRNLASAIGNQYLREGAVFAPNAQPGSFFYEMLAAQPRGTSDTSRIATDHLNNPSAINAIFLLGERERIAHVEEVTGGALDLTGPAGSRPRVPRFLKDGADSVGVAGAVMRVHVNIGLDSPEWLARHDALMGLTPQRPFEIAAARAHSADWRTTERKATHVAAFFRRLEPYHLADAEENGVPVGKRFLTADPAMFRHGAAVFARHCASCHSSKQPPAGVEDKGEWFAREIVKPDFGTGNFFSDEERYPVTLIGTNAARACATNAKAGHIWDQFSSQTYKTLPPVGAIRVWNPFTGQDDDFEIAGGGPGYYRTPSLVSLWSSAPFFHDNTLGNETVDPSVAGRMAAFDDAVGKLLWPERRADHDSVWRTKRVSVLQLPVARIPETGRATLRAAGCTEAHGVFEIARVPAGTPINLLANLDPEADPAALAAALVCVRETLGEISRDGLDDAAAAERLRTEVGPALLRVNKCPDFVTDRGHLFGTHLPDADKNALIEYLKTL